MSKVPVEVCPTLVCAMLLALVAAAHAQTAPDSPPPFAQMRAAASKLWTGANPAEGSYLVLLQSGSGLAEAARALASHRKAEIVEFSPDAPEALLPTLIGKHARYAAIFVTPDRMDVNLVRRFIVLSTILDSDPFCDVAFGFVTATTPQETQAFVQRIIRADREGVPQRTARWSVSNISQTYTGSSFVQGMPGDSHYVKLGDKEFARARFADLAKAGFVHIGGCGDPEGIWLFDDQRNLDRSKHWAFDPEQVGHDPEGEMPRIEASDLQDLRFDGSVVWTHVCHIGSTSRMFVEGDIVSTFGRTEQVEAYDIPAGRSVALAIIEAGASAFIAPLGPNFGAQSSIEQAAASELGLPLGDVMRRAYHDVVMDTAGHPEEIGVYLAGKPARWDPDGFTNHNSPHNRALYGDPLLQPFGDHRSPQTVRVESSQDGGVLEASFELTRSGYLGRTWYGNRGRDITGRGRIYETLELAHDVPAATIGSVTAQDAAGEPFALSGQTALLERIDGKTLLHLQLVTDDPKALSTAGAVVTVTVRLDAGGDPPTPELANKSQPPAPPALPPRPDGDDSTSTHVILTNLAEGDAYDGAVTRYQAEVHPDAKVLRFRGVDPEVVASDLASLAPRFVTVVLAPADLDVNFQSHMLRLCTGLDDDPFCDFSFGYVTGATPQEALDFVGNIARAWKIERPQQVLSVPTVGAESARSTGTASEFGVDWPAVRLTFGEVGGRDLTPEEIRARLQQNVADFSGKGVIMMGGHGSPTGIGGNISGADLRAVEPDLFPAVVYNYACMTGAVSTCWQWYERGDDFSRVKPRKVDPDESICLAILASGAPAYIASLEPRPAGPGMSAECLYAMRSGATLGEARRREYDLLVLGFLSWGEDGLVVPTYEDGQKKTRRDAVRDIMMVDASGAVLFGDPSYRICEPQGELIAVALKPASAGYQLECQLQLSSYSLGFDPYRSWPGGRRLASQLSAVVELPADAPAIERVAVLSVTGPGGETLEHAHLTWAIERDGESRRLHVKANCPPGAIRTAGTRAVFLINPEDGSGDAGPASPPPPRAGDAGDAGAEPGELQKTLDGPWHLVRREWQLGAFLEFIENFIQEHGETYGLTPLEFEFGADVADRRGRTVVIEAARTPLADILGSICTQLGLETRADAATMTVTFVAPGAAPASPPADSPTRPASGPKAPTPATPPAPTPRWVGEPAADSAGAAATLREQTRALQAALSANDVAAQYRTLNAIGRLRTPAALAALQRFYAETDQIYLRAYVATCIGIVDGEGAAQTLIGLLAREEEQTTRQALRRALRMLRAQSAAEHLAGAGLGHRDPSVRETAARALGGTAWSDAVPPLVAATRDRNLEVKIAATESLGRLPFDASIDHLLTLAGKSDPQVALTALWALGESGRTDERILDTAITRASKGPMPLRVQAASLLGRLGTARGVDTLLPLLRHRDWRLRSAAIGALAELRPRGAVAPLIDRLDREHGRLLADVADALQLITGSEYGADAELWLSWWEQAEATFTPLLPGADTGGAPAAGATVVSYHGIPIVSDRVMFLLDVSSSMAEPLTAGAVRSGPDGAPNGNRRLDTCQWELARVIRKLPRDTRFNIVTFDTVARAWQQGVIPATSTNRQQAIEFVDAQTPTGSTNLTDALELAFADRDVDTLYVLSDGAPARDTEEILRWVRRTNASRRIVIHTISAGALAASDFLERMARDSGGQTVAWE